MNTVQVVGGGLGVGGTSYVTFKILAWGLFLAGSLYTSGDTFGVDLVGQYDDIPLSVLGVDSDVPIPISTIEDLTVKWTIFQYSPHGLGARLNSEDCSEYYTPVLKKGESYFIKKECTSKVPLNQVDKVVVKVSVSGKLNGILPISQEWTEIISTSELMKGYSLEWS